MRYRSLFGYRRYRDVSGHDFGTDAGGRSDDASSQNGLFFRSFVSVRKNGLSGWNTRARINYSGTCPAVGSGLVAVQRTNLGESSTTERAYVRFLPRVNELENKIARVDRPKIEKEKRMREKGENIGTGNEGTKE